jgi:hypothetical protein
VTVSESKEGEGAGRHVLAYLLYSSVMSPIMGYRVKDKKICCHTNGLHVFDLIKYIFKLSHLFKYKMVTR